MKKTIRISVFTLAAVILAAPALAAEKSADDTTDLRELVTCFPAKGIITFLSKFDNLDAKQTDTISMIAEARIIYKDGGGAPDRFFMRGGTNETDFAIGPDGQITDFEKVKSGSRDAELCIEDKARAGRPKSESGINFSMSPDIQFRENTGFHDMAVLRDGLKDGKAHYKKMAPGPMRLLIPTFSHVMINYETDNKAPQFSAVGAGKDLTGLASDSFCDNPIIRVDDIEALGGDGLRVSGGPYTLLPVPNKKMLEKFSGCAADDKDEAEE